MNLRGTIAEETPAGIRVKQRNEGTNIPADIVRIVYHVEGIPAADFRAPFGKEARALAAGASAKVRKDYLDEALKGFEEILPKLTGNAKAKRDVQFKIAQVKAEQAEAAVTRQDAAIAALKAFKSDHADGWEIVGCLKLLARLQEEKGDMAGARDTYEDLGKVPGIPPDTKLESDVLVAKLLMRGGKYADAEKKLQALGTALYPATHSGRP